MIHIKHTESSKKKLNTPIALLKYCYNVLSDVFALKLGKKKYMLQRIPNRLEYQSTIILSIKLMLKTKILTKKKKQQQQHRTNSLRKALPVLHK